LSGANVLASDSVFAGPATGTIPATAWSISGNVATLTTTGTNTILAGDTVVVAQFPTNVFSPTKCAVNTNVVTLNVNNSASVGESITVAFTSPANCVAVNGTFTVASANSTTITYNLTHANFGAVGGTGTVTDNSYQDASFLNGTYTATAASANSVSYALTHANGSGTENGNVTDNNVPHQIMLSVAANTLTPVFQASSYEGVGGASGLTFTPSASGNGKVNITVGTSCVTPVDGGWCGLSFRLQHGGGPIIDLGESANTAASAYFGGGKTASGLTVGVSRTIPLTLTPGTTYTITGYYGAGNGGGAASSATFNSSQIIVEGQ
jgi:hypothetical protein